MLIFKIIGNLQICYLGMTLYVYINKGNVGTQEIKILDHVRIQKTLSNFYNVLFVFLVDEGKEDPNTAKTGHHRPASETPLKWRLADWPKMAQY